MSKLRNYKIFNEQNSFKYVVIYQKESNFILDFYDSEISKLAKNLIEFYYRNNAEIIKNPILDRFENSDKIQIRGELLFLKYHRISHMFGDCGCDKYNRKYKSVDDVKNAHSDIIFNDSDIFDSIHKEWFKKEIYYSLKDDFYFKKETTLNFTTQIDSNYKLNYSN